VANPCSRFERSSELGAAFAAGRDGAGAAGGAAAFCSFAGGASTAGAAAGALWRCAGASSVAGGAAAGCSRAGAGSIWSDDRQSVSGVTTASSNAAAAAQVQAGSRRAPDRRGSTRARIRPGSASK
jgi:hypothetical protein